MKIVDAVWEKRNLGKRTIELMLEKNDFLHNPDDIFANIESLEEKFQSEYTVVKVKTGNSHIGSRLTKGGFVFVETQINIQAMQYDIEIAMERYRPLFRETCCREVSSKEDVTRIRSEIEKGIFKTDRIALDPCFGKRIANIRYSNWVENEMARDGHLYYVIVEGDEIGFCLSREKGNIRYGLLTGVFENYSKHNYGSNLIYACLDEAIKKKFLIYHGAVSSNNSKILSLHESFGYRTKFMQEVYVRHKHSA